MKEKIIEFLKNNKSLKRPQLLFLLRELGFVLTDREMRSTIEEMITLNGFCIRSGNDGYSLITSRAELDLAVAYLNSKAEAIAIRKNCLTKNFRIETNESIQQTLFA